MMQLLTSWSRALLEKLTGFQIVNKIPRIFYYINPKKMHMLQSLFHLTTALHISGVTITHLQEHKTTVTTVSGNCYTVLLSVAIVEELELI
jgi:hypothetical protein